MQPARVAVDESVTNGGGGAGGGGGGAGVGTRGASMNVGSRHNDRFVGGEVSRRGLEWNEDLLAAAVENLQLGRFDAAMAHYRQLHRNLVGMAQELDSYPTTDQDAYDIFSPREGENTTQNSTLRSCPPGLPDSLLRRDILEDLEFLEDRHVPTMPSLPPCKVCVAQNITSAEFCRKIAHHIEPGEHLTSSEAAEFMCATAVLSARHREKVGTTQVQNSNEGTTTGEQSADKSGKKRIYKRWGVEDRYTLCIAIHLNGHCHKRLASILGDRTESQVRHFVSKHLRGTTLPSLETLLKNPPPGYKPPEVLKSLFEKESSNSTASGNTPRSDVYRATKSDFNSSLSEVLLSLDPKLSKLLPQPSQ